MTSGSARYVAWVTSGAPRPCSCGHGNPALAAPGRRGMATATARTTLPPTVDGHRPPLNRTGLIPPRLGDTFASPSRRGPSAFRGPPRPESDTCRRIGARQCDGYLLPCIAFLSASANGAEMKLFHVKQLPYSTRTEAFTRAMQRSGPVPFVAASRIHAHCAAHRLSASQPWRIDPRSGSIDATTGRTFAGRGERRLLRLRSGRTQPQPQRSGLRT